MPNRIVNIVSYSYKGGSGRSTAALNLAFELARQGHLVACLDMDIGAPGMHMILAEWDPKIAAQVERNDGEVGIQSFFNQLRRSRPEDLEALESAMVDVGAFNKGLFEENGGKLLCIFSSTRSRVIKDLADNSETVHDFYANYEILQQAVASRLAENDSSREVYIIVDAPNGITPVSLPLLKKADLILMFYRHSVQHVQGTVETAKKVRYYLLPEIGRRFVRIILVGSCVPEDLILGLRSMAGGGMENLAPDAREMLKKFRAIEGRLLKIKSTYAEVVSLLSEGEEGYIVEDEVLKFLEQPLIKADLLRQDLGHATDPEIPVSKNTRHKIELIARCVQDYAAAVLRRKYPHSR